MKTEKDVPAHENEGFLECDLHIIRLPIWSCGTMGKKVVWIGFLWAEMKVARILMNCSVKKKKKKSSYSMFFSISQILILN